MADTANCQSCCRLCLSEKMDTLQPIFGEATNDAELAKKIHQHLNIEITSSEKVSTMICQECTEKISSWNLYKEQCLQNQKKFEELTMPSLSSSIPNSNDDINPLANISLQIKEEPITESDPTDETTPEFIEEPQLEREDPLSGNAEQNDHGQIFVKSEPLDIEQSEEPMDQEYHEFPPTLSPHPPNNSEDYLQIQKSALASMVEIPERSRKNYETVYKNFMDWRLKENTTSFSEDTVLSYFKELTTKYKSSTLWTHYSTLKTTLNVKHNVNIEPYEQVRSLLKKHSEGYQPKRSEAFTGEEITKFINEAPDHRYLASKVALIMGVTGACRSYELYKMKFEDVQFYNGCIQVSVPVKKSKVFRKFSITDNFYNIVKKYVDLRPPEAPNSFFLNFHNNKCTKQVIGINKFGKMGKEIAQYLKLKNPDRYTGHCLRWSAATLYADGETTLTVLKALKRHGGFTSVSVAGRYSIEIKEEK